MRNIIGIQTPACNNTTMYSNSIESVYNSMVCVKCSTKPPFYINFTVNSSCFYYTEIIIKEIPKGGGGGGGGGGVPTYNIFTHSFYGLV